MRGFRPRSVRAAVAGTAAAVALAVGLTACGGGDDDDSAAPAAANGTTVVTVGAVSNGAAKQVDLSVPVVEEIRAKLPAEIRDSGELVIGLGLLPTGAPPLGYIGSDQKTLTGSEPDLGQLIAAVFGLKPVLENATWENLFVGIDSGRTDVGITNITVTEERKRKYDFAAYRDDNLAFEVLKSNDWNFDGDYRNLDGLTVAVGSGTNQEKILVEWQTKLAAEGKKLEIKFFQDTSSATVALSSGKVDALFGPNPFSAYHVTQTASTPNPTRVAGQWSGAGESLQGLIAATTKKDSGLAQPLADAINYLIKNGQYEKWLAAWNLQDEAVSTSEVNPPGLPLTNA
ncbi:transporter substrate-binding domain-containing protein [Frankia sp. CNm7]|uniref:Transporter substrate-binding domain-containing protein n=1 Tax=Frankia nepalensis TaxID=1836974 RepID=A0A937R6H2_9ACTN|nr:transporter substrate-binding domain-containing protein [Frankia nepalensis]MBL7496605.1 transporter substrate-binding domain-containing protein [Frankia nepalensis]MBL7513348.1 transporter substrate-binding domain-containing protein [Frankia nepalensis]MBL7521607.1 transporter substrate-binding domain-containing protein [Frankia nepalensis]MBL7626613.1 transporter substrate-binding domain-containing protein [Frankia nepalensis]